MRAQTGVAMFNSIKPRVAGGSILTFMADTARKLNTAVLASPWPITNIDLGTVTVVGSNVVFAPAIILTGLAFTFVNIHFTKKT